MDNRRVAAHLDLWADILQAEGKGRYRVAAYRRAADTVARWQEPVSQVRDKTSLPGVGVAIASRIEALLEDAWPELEEARVRLGLSLIEPEILRGDLHSHTRATDGRATIQEMAEAAQARGYEYLAITDHSKATSIAGGLDEDAMRSHLEDIRRVSEDVDIALLAGAEVDILKDGSLDFPDDLLADMDVVVCSVHFRHGMEGGEQTERILHAMANEHADVLAHPTARRGKRPPMDIDIERIAAAAGEQGWGVELNGSPDRLDLRGEHVAIARQHGAMLALDSDAHATAELANVRHALRQAQMADVPQEQILNALPLDRLLRRLA